MKRKAYKKARWKRSTYRFAKYMAKHVLKGYSLYDFKEGTVTTIDQLATRLGPRT